ncbi:cytochrome c oxidase subunit IV [Sorangium cellulosum]|jgi:cytochrome c oxidase subunit 4|uniref:Cytochrome c oxidase subunit IV n=1 Tax=Sorangium cellulosum TaxID=56 RepID=A0A4P2Q9A6_SORCE|nr:cytochrome C oxidase subunit IV family protein [Sorangium cellulosum]AUX26197.1 cytochrome c oxidase subunit IV [Sorangium cellulosum]
MSTHAEAAAGHGHGHGHGHGADHVPHVLPLKVYIATWLALLVLTVVTVAVSYVDLGAANLAVAMLIASMKAGVVALIFMHLKWDLKFHTLIFLSSLIFLAIFIGFTMFDTNNRGRAEALEAERPANMKAPFDGKRAADDWKIKKPKAAPPPAKPQTSE